MLASPQSCLVLLKVPRLEGPACLPACPVRVWGLCATRGSHGTPGPGQRGTGPEAPSLAARPFWVWGRSLRSPRRPQGPGPEYQGPKAKAQCRISIQETDYLPPARTGVSPSTFCVCVKGTGTRGRPRSLAATSPMPAECLLVVGPGWSCSKYPGVLGDTLEGTVLIPAT